MPTFILQSNSIPKDNDTLNVLQKHAREIISEEIGKSPQFVLTMISECTQMQFGESSKPCAYAEIKNVGKLDATLTDSLSNRISSMISESLNIEKDRIYIEFQESERHLWGWNGKTFA